MEYLVIIVMVAVTIGYLYYERQKATENQQNDAAVIKAFATDIYKIGVGYQKNGIPEIESDIKLKRGEKLYVKLIGIEWKEFRKVSTGNFTAHGLSGRVRIAKGLSYRFGSGQMFRESKDLLKTIDSGDLYVTDRGLFFRGSFGNKNLAFKDIIMISPMHIGVKIERNTGKDIYIPYNFAAIPAYMSAITVAWDNEYYNDIMWSDSSIEN